jgi:putative phage-type endonuclease
MLSPEQLVIRRTGLGSSDISAVAGVNPFCTKYDVYCDKRGLRTDADEAEVANALPVRVGNLVETLIGDLYQEETGAILHQGTTTVHPDIPWVIATPDRFTDADRLVEIKWVGWRMAHAWTKEDDGIPAYVRAQIEWQMFATGAVECDVAALIAGEDFRIYRLQRNPSIVRHLLELGGAFWVDHVVAGVAPPVDDSESARDMLERMYRQTRPALLSATPAQNEMALATIAAKEARKEAERIERLTENRLVESMGDAEGIVGDFGKATLKRSKGHNKRTLRLTQRKEEAA